MPLHPSVIARARARSQCSQPCRPHWPRSGRCLHYTYTRTVLPTHHLPRRTSYFRSLIPAVLLPRGTHPELILGLPAFCILYPPHACACQIDCSWLRPTWLFDAVAEGSASTSEPVVDVPMQTSAASGGAASVEAQRVAEGMATLAARRLSGLRELSVFINSPGARPTTYFGGTGQGEERPFDEGCALELVAKCAVAHCPRLERLFIEWYDEDAMPTAGVARALQPLAALGSLREVHWIRSTVDCTCFSGKDGLLSAPHECNELLASPSGARVLVHDDAVQTIAREEAAGAAIWALEDAVGLLPAVRGLVPVHMRNEQ